MSRHIMIDTETLGTRPTSMILTLAATDFTPDTGVIHRKFYKRIDMNSYSGEPAFTFDPSTMIWWIELPDAARKEAFLAKPREDIRNVMAEFRDWCVEGGNFRVYPWSHGASFDVPLIEFTMGTLGITPPWDFWNVRDTRTIYDLAKIQLGKITLCVDIDLPQHHSLGDCIRQVEALKISLNKLGLKL